MTEVEREAILYERAQNRLAKVERRELEKKMRQLEEMNAPRPSRGPSSATEQKRKTLEELRAKRQRKKRKEDSDSDYTGDEDGEVDNKSLSEEDVDEDESDIFYNGRGKAEGGKRSSSKLQTSNAHSSSSGNNQSIDLETANKLRISRDKIVKWMFHPQFDDLARGCLLRLSVIRGDSQVYRLVEIKKIVKYHRTYRINNIITIKAAILKYGKSEKTFCLDVISNSDFTQQEFDRWMDTLKEEHQPAISMKMAESRINAWSKFESIPLTDDIVSAMVAAKREIGSAPRNLLSEKTMLAHLREEAQSAGNYAEMERIEEELNLVNKELANQASSKSSASTSRMEALAEINRKNRRMNVMNSSVNPEVTTVKKSGNDNKLDPFSRRKCQPSNFNSLFGSPDEGEKDQKMDDEKGQVVEEEKDHHVTTTLQSEKNNAEKAEPIDLISASSKVDIDIDI